MWVFCCGMQRSGSTLQFQITAELVERAGLGRRVEWVPPEQFPELRHKYASSGGWKVFKSHVCTEEMTKEFDQGNAVGTYVFRDLRDVMASAIRKNSITFDKFWQDGLLDIICLGEYRKWTRLPRVLVSRYEDMMSDLGGEVERIAAHLGIEVGSGTVSAIASEYTRGKQLERIEDSKTRGQLRPGVREGILFDAHSLLHTNHITSGDIGSWRDVLSPGQVALVEDRYREWLLTHGYQLTQGALSRSWRKLLHAQKSKLRALRRPMGKVT